MRDNEMRSNLKLYVWEDVLRDYTAGIMVALAPSVAEARNLILEECPHANMLGELMQEPDIHTEPVAFVLWGGS